MKVILKNDWMQIIKKGEQHIIQYNSGDFINSVREIKVSKSDASQAQKKRSKRL